jgi:hypothetical protein
LPPPPIDRQRTLELRARARQVLLGLASGGEHDRRIRHPGIALERALEMALRQRVVAKLDQHRAQVEMGAGVVGIEVERDSVGCGRFLKAPELVQRVAEVDVGARVGRCGRNRLAIARFSGGEIAGVLGLLAAGDEPVGLLARLRGGAGFLRPAEQTA